MDPFFIPMDLNGWPTTPNPVPVPVSQSHSSVPGTSIKLRTHGHSDDCYVRPLALGNHIPSGLLMRDRSLPMALQVTRVSVT
jgi:hypothetical protein